MAAAVELNGENRNRTDNRSELDGKRALISPTPLRLAGALATGTVLADSSTTLERVRIGGLTTVYACGAFSSITGTATITIHPLLSDATAADDTDGTRRTTNTGTTAAATVNGTQYEASLTCGGEEFVDIEVTISGGGADTATVTFIDVRGI